MLLMTDFGLLAGCVVAERPVDVYVQVFCQPSALTPPACPLRPLLPRRCFGGGKDGGTQSDACLSLRLRWLLPFMIAPTSSSTPQAAPRPRGEASSCG
jgi:hypothetical protein